MLFPAVKQFFRIRYDTVWNTGVFLAVLLAFAVRPSAAAVTPFQIGFLGNDWQLVPAENVAGLRLNLLSTDSESVYGLDFGVCSDAGNFSGVRLNAVSGSETFNGVAVALCDLCGDVRGVQISGFNLGLRKVRGLQLGIVSCGFEACGAQIGLLNLAESLRGVQIGVVNCAFSCHGVQIGLVNCAGVNRLTFLPFLRVSF
jgi:hypothetical protein